MNKKHIITIAGKLGSGKSSTAKMVAEILGYKHYSTGDFFRSIADERGISTVELNKAAETDLSIDKEVDDRNIEIGKMENVVLDSRLGFHFIPESFKVFLELNPIIASQRILNDKKNNLNRHNETSSAFDTAENILNSISERMLLEKNRYKELYGINDNTSHDNFDLVIDTEKIPLEDVSKKIIEEYNNWLNK
ncbi:MAG: AAA family ATPase [Candidatus Paceibacterota bacterium]